MKFIDFSKKHSAALAALLLVLGCSFGNSSRQRTDEPKVVEKQTAAQTKTKEKPAAKTKRSADEDELSEIELNEETENSPSRNSSRTSGDNPPELIGKWCYLANIQARDGGRMSERCFVLNENGSYEYHSETSNSNPYGGSTSETNDAGRWSATETTLTAYSDGGETVTYPLEKRNHPKTGDPMLVVDGDAFVTFYQKQPW